jgi:hypothetical protein
MAARKKKPAKRAVAGVQVAARDQVRVQVKNSTEFRIGYEITWQGAELVRVEIFSVEPKRGHLWPE